MKKLFFSIFFQCFSLMLMAQNAQIKGKIVGIDQLPIEDVLIQSKSAQAVSDKNGNFLLQVPKNQRVAIEISHIKYIKFRQIIDVLDQNIELRIVLQEKEKILDEVEIIAEKNREEVSTISLDPTKFKQMPVPFNDIGQMIASLGGGVFSNNELSSTYTVRGGSFDENLVYVNNIEIYRPFIVRAGQQEGLSFVNPDLVKKVEFSAGGWQSKFGDKLSSVLNIEYKNPTKFDASGSIGLLGGTAHIEGLTKNKKFSYLLGFRQKSSKYLFNTLPTKGQYLPVFNDLQGFFNFDLTSKNKRNQFQKTNLSALLSYAQNRYQVVPQNSVTDFGAFSSQEASYLRLEVGFDGREIMNYDTWQGGLNFSHRFNEKFVTNLIFSGTKSQEREYIDVESAYRLGDVNTNSASGDFGKLSNIRGIGSLFSYARNALNSTIFSAETRNEFFINDQHQLDFGLKYTNENITDQINEYSFFDSADFTSNTRRLFTDLNLQSQRMMGFTQHTIRFKKASQVLTYGARFNYWDLNGEILFSPRLQYSIKPNWKADMRFNLSAGMYHQPPFYRELRNFQGELNRNLKAQSSLHLISGLNWNFKYAGRPFTLTAEMYYKSLQNVIPYDMDNVRLRYYALNNAKAYVQGIDVRVSGEFLKGTESWFNISLMKAEEDVEDDKNPDGTSKGYIRRPTDQRLTFTIYFEDHMPNNPSLRVNVRVLYGSGLPFGIPNNPNGRAIFDGSDYRRVDIGFSKIINLNEIRAEKGTKAGHPSNLWIGLEILNLLGANNKISYLWISDFNNNQYAVPNTLSQRFFNLRAVLQF